MKRCLVVGLMTMFVLSWATPALAKHCEPPLEPGDNYAEIVQGASEDEFYCDKHAFLGPVGWWWNTVYYDFMSANIALMIFFGWELFLVPIGLSLAGIVIIASAWTDRGY